MTKIKIMLLMMLFFKLFTIQIDAFMINKNLFLNFYFILKAQSFLRGDYMLALLGFAMVFVFMFLIMTKRMSALVALILIPITFALIGGFYANMGPMMLEGIQKLAPTGIMLMFAILYFGIMIDSGLFDPVINRILKFVKGDPLKIVVGTAILTIIVSLDGDGTTTYMITVSAMYPLYKRLGMNPLILAGIVMLGAGVTNLTPWGGPTARVMSALGLDASELFTPLIPGMIAGALWVVFVAYYLGKKKTFRNYGYTIFKTNANNR